MSEAATFTATEFKAKCLEILDRLAAHALTRVVVTKRGKAVAVLTPPENPETAVRQLHGFMRGTVVAPPGFDFTAPVLDEDLSAARGQLHQ
ncbi:MAG: type II toxin-antitoxin system Phd/YefM family antitoxin [Caulobacteraceae bacterium]